MASFEPSDADALGAIVRDVATAGETVAIQGAGTKAGWGRPVEATHALSLAALAGVVEHDAPELVLTARAGTSLAAVEQTLSAHRQVLAFEPPDWALLLGTEPGRQTLGGVLAAGVSGPRRFHAGAARDHLLGFEAVNGRGERFRAGGRVVKNVTGYDLPKLLCGSFGTLALLTEVTLRLHPAPETERTIVVSGLDAAAAVALFTAACASPHEPTAAAHLPRVVAARLDLPGAATLLRVEGHGPSVAFRADALGVLARAAGPTEMLAPERSGALWRAVRDAAFFHALGEHALWRLSVVPSRAAALVAALAATLPVEHALDWAGGLCWLAVAPDIPDAGAATIRGLVGKHGGGQATLFRAPASTRATIDVFDPVPAALATLTERVRSAFDPLGVFNPGKIRGAPPLGHPARGQGPLDSVVEGMGV